MDATEGVHVGDRVEGIGGRVGTVAKILTSDYRLVATLVRVDWDDGTTTENPTYSLSWVGTRDSLPPIIHSHISW